MKYLNDKIYKMIRKTKSTDSEEVIDKKLSKIFGDIDLYIDDDGKTVLHLLCNHDNPNNKLKMVFKSIINKHPNLINTLDFDRNTFMHCIVDEYWYNATFILEILTTALTNNFKVNSINDCGNTILHIYLEHQNTIIEDDIIIYDLLNEYGFDSSLKNVDEETIYDILKKVRIKDILYQTFSNKFHERTNNMFLKEEKKKHINNKNYEINKQLEKIDSVAYLMNDKEYLSSPSIGREQEVISLMVTLANRRKNALLVGESGVGKTTIVDELVYRIQNNNVRDFLKDQKIIEVNATSLISGTSLRGSFEKKIKDIIELCLKENIILFIDEIHEVYGAGLCEGNHTNDMAAMLKFYIDRKNLKVIGTTTKEEYNKYFSNDALKRRFEVINVNEPDKETLKSIIFKVFNDMTMEYNIGNSIITSDIIDKLIALTSSRKKYDDPLNNPDLVISIIDKIYSYAYYDSRDELTHEDLIKGINFCDRIYPSIKERYIKEIEDICSKNILEESIKKKVLNFSDYVKNNL